MLVKYMIQIKMNFYQMVKNIMTAMVIIDAGQNPKQMIGNFTREQHIQLALVKSDNNSAKVLCDNFPGGRFECIDAAATHRPG